MPPPPNRLIVSHSAVLPSLSACNQRFIPLVGISHGAGKSHAAPVMAWNDLNENRPGGSINGGCIGNTSSVDLKDVGKRFSDDSGSCGAAYLPAVWRPGLKASIHWKVDPYPDWNARVLPQAGLTLDPEQQALMKSYIENHRLELPPPQGYGVEFAHASAILVHFLDCNQIFITYGYAKEDSLPDFFELFRQSQKLCRRRPVIRSMADYRKHKAEMDAVREERRHIPQVILPNYMKQLEAAGQLPNQPPAGRHHQPPQHSLTNGDHIMPQHLYRLIFSLSAVLLSLSACNQRFIPFVGISHGANKSYAAPVAAWNYLYENINGGSINGGCIGNTSGVDLKDFGKRFSDNSGSCGAAYLPAEWRPGLKASIHWQVDPYPHWNARVLPQAGLTLDPEQLALIESYFESYRFEVPLPPPPQGYGVEFAHASGILVHFLDCNQIFITYGFPQGKLPDFFDLFRQSQKLCRRRPVVRSMADYRKHKAEMDAVREERKHIPQVILPNYMKQLEAAGQLPNQPPAGRHHQSPATFTN